MSEGVEAGVLAAVEHALDVLEAQGAVLQTIDLPHSRHGIAAYYLIATAEASSNLARYDGVRYGVRAASEATTARDDVRIDAAAPASAPKSSAASCWAPTSSAPATTTRTI